MGSILLNKFKWGHAFYELNGTLLDAYAKCDSAQAVIERDQRFRTGQDSFNDTYTPNRDMPPSESSEEEEEEEEEEKKEDLTMENLSLKSTNQ